MIRSKAVIQNNAGIHVRPSGVIMGEIGHYPGKLLLTAKNQQVEITSIMALLSLGLMKDDEVEIEVTGVDEENICSKLKELMERIDDLTPRD